MTESSAEPQWSPDGRWWWDGHQWVAATPPAPGSPYGTGIYGTGPYGQYPAYGEPLPRGKDGKAIASLVCSLVGCGIGSVAGVVLGHLSRSEARREHREPSGLALAGLIIGYLGIAAAVLVVAGFLLIGVGTGLTLRQVDPFGEIEASGPAAVALHSAGQAEEGYLADHAVYASSTTLLYPYGYEDQDGVTVRVRWIQGTAYCLEATDADKTLYLSTSEPDAVTAMPCG
jgi:hypothetical protein